MCKGMAGGWLGGSVVGLGGSACTGRGAGPEEELLVGFSKWTLGGEGGMWGGGEGMGSVKGKGAVVFIFSSLLFSSETAGGAVTGAEVGSVLEDSGA